MSALWMPQQVKQETVEPFHLKTWVYAVREGKLYLELHDYSKNPVEILEVLPAKENYFIRVAK